MAPQDVVLVLGYTALGHLPTMMSLSLFVAIVVTIGRMYRDSEIVIWFSGGVGLPRFVRPVLRSAWPVLLVAAVLLLFIWPWGNRNSNELRDRYQQRSDLSRVQPGVFQSSSDGSRVFFVERESDDIDDKTGDRTLASFETYRVLVKERVAREAQAKPPKSLPTIELIRDPNARNQGELAWRFGMLLATANLLLLGLGLAATNPRRPNNWNLFLALLAWALYFNLVNLSQAWVGNGRVGLGTALAGLHGGAFMLALALLWWRDHAAVLHLWPRRRLRAAVPA